MTNRKVTENIEIENARIGFRNFAGKESQYNPAGKRNFCVFLDSDLAETLERDGWNVRWLRPRDEDEAPQGYLEVTVRLDNFPPKLVMISSKGLKRLNEGTVSMLDWVDIEEIDIIIRPYNWVIQEGTKNEKRGVKAYLESLHVKIMENVFDKKWADLEEDESDDTPF